MHRNTIDLQGEKSEQSRAAAAELEQAANRTRHGLFDQLLTRVNDSIKISTDASVVLHKTLSLLQMKWLRRLGSKLFSIMTRIQIVTLKTYHIALAINTRLDDLSAQGVLLGSTCMLWDALGRPTPLPLQTINSWEAFDAIMEVRFRELHGYRKILNKEYALQDSRTGRDISRQRPWDGAIVNGQQLHMGMIFKSETFPHSCPGCKQSCPKPLSPVVW